MKPPISLVLVTGTACNLGCPLCPAGRHEEQPSGTFMTVDMAEKIISKACKESRVLSICLYYFQEPFLHPKIKELVQLCNRYKKKALLSTNLVRFNNVAEVMAESPYNVIVSLSGFTQPIYERYHRKGDIEKVKENMLKLRALRKPGTTIQVSWHRFSYNSSEEPLMRKFVEDMGEGWRFVAYGVGLLPLEKVEARWNGDLSPRPEDEHLMIAMAQARALCQERKHWKCDLQDQTLVVNSEGLVYNCGTRNNTENLRPSFFDSTVSEIMSARQTDPMCVSCKAKGLHIYGMQAYTIPRNSIAHKLIELYKSTKLQGVIPWLTDIGIRGKRFYMRPQK